MLYLHTEDMVGPEIHEFSLDDQLTVDFIHQLNWLLKYFETAVQCSSQFSAFNFTYDEFLLVNLLDSFQFIQWVK